MSLEIHFDLPMPRQVIGRCEPCDKTLNGTAFEHFAEAHPDEMYECWTDPTSGAWVILRRAREFEAPHGG